MRVFDKMRKHTGGFGLLNLFQMDYARVLTAVSELDPNWTRGTTPEASHQQNLVQIRVEACPAFAVSRLSSRISVASVARLVHFVLPLWAEPPQHL